MVERLKQLQCGDCATRQCHGAAGILRNQLAGQQQCLLLLCDRWTNPTTYSALVASAQLARMTFANIYLQLVDDNTNVSCKWSLDGVNWTQITSFARAAFLANANQIGLAIFTQQNGGTVYLQSDWLRRTA